MFIHFLSNTTLVQSLQLLKLHGDYHLKHDLIR
jgi:hypothetical protein